MIDKIQNINGIEIIDISKFNINDVSEYDKKEVKILLDNLETIKEKEPKLYENMNLIKYNNDYYIKFWNYIIFDYSKYKNEYNFQSLSWNHEFNKILIVPNKMRTFNIWALKRRLEYIQQKDLENSRKMEEWDQKKDEFIKNLEQKLWQKIELEKWYFEISNWIFKIIVRVKQYEYFDFDFEFDKYDFRRNSLEEFEKIEDKKETKEYYQKQEEFLKNKEIELFLATNFKTLW